MSFLDSHTLDPQTLSLLEKVDRNAQIYALPYLSDSNESTTIDLNSGDTIRQWQEAKGQISFEQNKSWGHLSPIYARYGTHQSQALCAYLEKLESAPYALAMGSGMTAITTLFDALLGPGDEAICFRQVYNKSRTYLERRCLELGGKITVVDDGDIDALYHALNENTRCVFAETYTNPLLYAQDLSQLSQIGVEYQSRYQRRMGLVLDTTVATPWAFNTPPLSYPGVDAICASGTKAMGCLDQTMWGYVATKHPRLANSLMDLLALRGGILDHHQAAKVLSFLNSGKAQSSHRQRVSHAQEVKEFLLGHPKIETVYYANARASADACASAGLNANDVDADAESTPAKKELQSQYQLGSSLLSFRLKGHHHESQAAEFSDRLASTGLFAYALSFDGLRSKVNHHQSVSEYFTPPPRLRRQNIDRLIRLGIGLEHPKDLIAALQWALSAS